MRYHQALTVLILSAAFSGCSSRYQQNPDLVDCTYVHRYGVEVPPDDWSSRGENGQVISRLKNGVTVTKNFSAGTLEGETMYTFPHCDTVECVETYSQGCLDKKVQNYFCGVPKEEVQYRPGGQRVTSWYDNGTPQSIEEYEDHRLVYGEYYNPSHKLESQVSNGQGFRVGRDEYGELTSTDTIEQGRMVLRTTYHPNGSPKEIIPYEDGVVQGERKTFLPAGEPSTLELWDGGVQHGVTVIFQNGEKYAEVPYVRGMKKGVEKRYRNGKAVVEEISWYEDMRHGPSFTYIGETIKTDYYYQGKEVSKNQYDMLASPYEKG